MKVDLAGWLGGYRGLREKVRDDEVHRKDDRHGQCRRTRARHITLIRWPPQQGPRRSLRAAQDRIAAKQTGGDAQRRRRIAHRRDQRRGCGHRIDHAGKQLAGQQDDVDQWNHRQCRRQIHAGQQREHSRSQREQHQRNQVGLGLFKRLGKARQAQQHGGEKTAEQHQQTEDLQQRKPRNHLAAAGQQLHQAAGLERDQHRDQVDHGGQQRDRDDRHVLGKQHLTAGHRRGDQRFDGAPFPLAGCEVDRGVDRSGDRHQDQDQRHERRQG